MEVGVLLGLWLGKIVVVDGTIVGELLGKAGA